MGIKSGLFVLLITWLLICATSLHAQTNVSGIINNSQSWVVEGSPYIIDGDTTVDAQVTLTIEAGVQVRFSGPYWFKVEGTLVAQGAQGAPIEFGSVDIDTYWHRLEFLPGSDNSILSYVLLSKAGAMHTNGSQAYGAIYLVNSHPDLNNLTIFNNRASGLFAVGISANITIAESEFRNNVNTANTGIGAGGIYAEGTAGSSVNINDCIITHNSVNTHGGGIYVVGVDGIAIRNSIISNNRASGPLGFGGGIYITATNAGANNNLIEDSTIADNIADQDGGGIWVDESSVTIQNSLFKSNIARNTQGGAIYIGDTDTQDGLTSSTDIIGNMFNDNTATELGGAVYIENGNHIVSGNVFYANAADDFGGDIENEQGGALIIRSGNIEFNNNVIANNRAYASGGAVSISATGNVSQNSFVYNRSNQTIRITNNLAFHGNTIFANAAEISTVLVPSQAALIPTINNNNIFQNGFAYWIDNFNVQTMNVQSNWWGTTDLTEIEFNVSGELDYSNPLQDPLDDTPVSPPQVVGFSYSDDSATLSWSANPEPDVVGYKAYWGRQPIPNLSEVLDVGSSTSVVLSNLASDQDYYFAVTAYDSSNATDSAATINNDNQIDGFESWYSQQYYKPKLEAQVSDGGGAIDWIFACLLLFFGWIAGRKT